MIDLQNYGQCIGYERITVADTAIGFTEAKYKNVDVSGTGKPLMQANAVLVTVAGTAGTNDIRFTQDGTTPTTGAAGVGHLAVAGPTSDTASFVIRGRSNIAKFRAIRSGGTSAEVTCSFFVN